MVVSGPYSMPAGTNGAMGPYSMPGESTGESTSKMQGLLNSLKNPAIQKVLLQGGIGLIKNAQEKKQAEEKQLMEMLGQMNPAQSLQGLQSSFGMPNMQSINGLLGR